MSGCAPPGSAAPRHPPHEGEGWGAALRFALRAWGMAPRDVWRLSVREWRALTAGDVAPLGRTELEALMRAWPDDVILTRKAGEVDRAKRGGGGKDRSETGEGAGRDQDGGLGARPAPSTASRSPSPVPLRVTGEDQGG